MKVIVMRHGEAAGLSSTVLSDKKRNLTDNGQAQAFSAGEVINNHFNVVKVIASDYNRATQTGQAVAQVCGCPFEQSTHINLSQTNLDAMIEQLEVLNAELEADDTVVLVSHIPLVYQLTALVCRDTMGSFHFHTAAFFAADFPSGQALGNSRFDFR